MEKPKNVFDRDAEWSELTRFVDMAQQGGTLGVVSGRRRQGKTFLLDTLCQAYGGLYFSATEAVEAEALMQLGEAIASFLGSPAPLQFASWEQAIDALLSLGDRKPFPVVLDEFPYLVKNSPILPSILQRTIRPLRRESRNSFTRLILCGSALSFMGSFLSGNAPLRGRAGLELSIRSLDYRTAAAFWGIKDPRLAVLTHAIVGGTPAYRREYVQNDAPEDLGDFDSWVARTVLNPATPLFREARYLLAEETELRDSALYHSALAAVAYGNTTRAGIASYLARKSNEISHPLTVLEDAGLLVKENDMFRENRSRYHVAEPLLTFYHAIMRPIWGQLERANRARALWRHSRSTFLSKIVGPHFERICRTWASDFVSWETFDGEPTRVGSGRVNDPQNRTTHEIDVAVLGLGDTDEQRILSIGEVKWNETMGRSHFERLLHVRDLLQSRQDKKSEPITLACYSGKGFTEELHRLGGQGEVILVDLARLYHGD